MRAGRQAAPPSPLARRLRAALILAALAPAPAAAIVGGEEERDPAGLRRGIVALERDGRPICSGALVAPDLVLTAAHCLAAGRPDRVLTLDAAFRPRRRPVLAAEAHPAFVPGRPPAEQTGPDLALLRLGGRDEAGLAPLGLDGHLSAAPEQIVVAGFGIAAEDAPAGRRVLRAARGLKAVPALGPARIFVDAATDGERMGRSACHGDSGGPLLGPGGDGRPAVAGIVTWTSGPLNRREAACGGLTAVAPVANHGDWIAAAARRLSGARTD